MQRSVNVLWRNQFSLLPVLPTVILSQYFTVVDINSRKFCRSSSHHGRKRRTIRAAVVVKKIESKKKLVDVYSDMKLGELAAALQIPIDEVKSTVEKLNSDGFQNSKELEKNYHLSMSSITMVASAFGFKPKLVPRVVDSSNAATDLTFLSPPPISEKELVPRPPMITIMGHVDHGKTTLLDRLRNSRIVETEFGGITQHIGAFTLNEKGCKMTFLDTPGHAAFAKMRERGAHSTDIVVLVVAADDGVNEQTIQSIRYAKEANVPIVVAINKVDKSNADPLRAKQSLIEHGVHVDTFGGETLCTEISALHGTNISELKESILLQAEVMNLRSTPKGPVEGVVIESQTVKGVGKSCTMIVQRGTLSKGDILVAGGTWAKVRLMRDEFAQSVVEAGPSSPVVVFGWRETLPSPGDKVLETENEHVARQIVQYRQSEKMAAKANTDWESTKQQREEIRKKYLERREKLWSIGFRTGSTLRLVEHKEHQYRKDSASSRPELRIMLFSDVDGTLEAILNLLDTYNSNEVELDLVKFGVGPPSESDINLASSLDVLVYCFNVEVMPATLRLASNNGVTIETFNVIYRLIEDLKNRLSDLLPEETELKQIGEGHVIKIFSVLVKRKRQCIAGTLVDWGSFESTHSFRVMRGADVIYDGAVQSMKINTQLIKAAKVNEEVGLLFIDEKVKFMEDDIVESYCKVKVKRNINWYLPGF